MSTVRTRTDWEVIAISACWVAMWIVVAICFMVLAVFATAFGVAQLKAHWP